jgi:hypothetical protein
MLARLAGPKVGAATYCVSVLDVRRSARQRLLGRSVGRGRVASTRSERVDDERREQGAEQHAQRPVHRREDWQRHAAGRARRPHDEEPLTATAAMPPTASANTALG